MHFNVYNVFYSQCSDQRVSADISAAIFRVILLLQEHKGTGVVSCYHHSVTIKIIISVKITQL